MPLIYTGLAASICFLAGCSSTNLKDETWDEDPNAQQETYSTYKYGNAIDIARGDLSFVDTNAYRFEPLFRPDPLHGELSDFVFDLAFGLLEVAISSQPTLIATSQSTDSLSVAWSRENTLSVGPTKAMSLALQAASQPFQCYLEKETRTRMSKDAKTRIGLSLRDVCRDTPA